MALTNHVEIAYNLKVLKMISAHQKVEMRSLGRRATWQDKIKVRREFQVIDDHIAYAKGEQNWDEVFLQYFESDIDVSNRRYAKVVSFLNEQGVYFADKTIYGSLYVVTNCMVEELINVGIADSFGRYPVNTGNEFLEQAQEDWERQRTGCNAKANGRAGKRRGPRGNTYHALYTKWIFRLIPALQVISTLRNRKKQLTVIGLVLCLGGFHELYIQYFKMPPSRRVIDKMGNESFVDISLSQYLYGRMKTVHYDACKSMTSNSNE